MTKKKFILGVLVLLIGDLALSNTFAAELVVDTLRDDIPSLTDNKCSLREAVAAANTNAAVDSCIAGESATEDSIRFFVETPAIIVLADELEATQALIINGLGPNNLTIDANFQSRHFLLNPNVGGSNNFGINHLSLINGRVFNSDFLNSGGSLFLRRNQQLSIDNVVFENNQASNGAGAIMVDNDSDANFFTSLTIKRSVFTNSESLGPTAGGAIRMGFGSQLFVNESTFAQNRTVHSNGSGGAISIFSRIDYPSSATIVGSTFNQNSANNRGGAISISGGVSLNLTDSTIVNNTSDADSNGTGTGGGIHIPDVTAKLSLTNTIIANNQNLIGNVSSEDLFIGSLTSTIDTNGYNFIGTDEWGDITGVTGGLGMPNASRDFIGTVADPLDPQLLPLADNGGPTPTMAIPEPTTAAISLVLDNGNCTSLTDQRGFGFNSGSAVQRAFDVGEVDPVSIEGNQCDIGAYEFGKVELITKDSDFDGINDNVDDCPNHFNPSQDSVCTLGIEPIVDSFCLPIKTVLGTIAVICL